MTNEPTWRSVGLPPNRVPGGLPGPNDLEVLYAEPFNDFFHPNRVYEFMVEKPDDDLYFPINSRKSRGWCQVRSPHKAISPHPALSGYAVRHTPATGTDIPIEIVRNIIQCLDYSLDDPGVMRLHDKRALAACALVSRSWASLCQRKLFYSITLRCAADVFTLLSFLRATRSQIKDCIRDLRIEPYSASDEPWLHHVASIYPYLHWFPPRITGHRSIDEGRPIPVVFRGPIARGQGVVRSIHQALPRRAPAFSTHIQRLCLSNITFRNFDDLAHLVSELPDLHYLDCERLRIEGSLPHPPAVLRDTPTVTMTKCDYSWASIWLLKDRRPTRRRGPRDDRINDDDWARIGNLASLVAAGFESATTLVPISDSESYTYSENDGETTVYSMSLTYTLSASQFMTFAVKAKSKLPQTHILYVTELRLIMAFGKTDAADYDCWTRINWAEFDRVSAAFPRIERLQLDFMLESDLMSFLMNEKSLKTGFEKLRERKRDCVGYQFHFGSQPFDWPVGAYMCKVGLRPRRPSPTAGQLPDVREQVQETRSQMAQQCIAQLIRTDQIPFEEFFDSSGAYFRRYNVSMEEVESTLRMYIDPRDVGCEDTLVDKNSGEQDKRPRYDYFHTSRRRTRSGSGGLDETEALQEAVDERYGKRSEVRERAMTIILGDPHLSIVYV